MTRRPAAHEWPEAATALLRRLWITGVSCKLAGETIGKETGFWPTRNAVAGKASRLGLPGRQSPIKARAERLDKRPSERKTRWAKTADPRRLDTAPQAGRETDRRAELPARPEAAQPVLRAGSECRWPLTNDRPWRFCGDTCQVGSSYCPTHDALAHRPIDPKIRINPRQDSDVQTVKHRVAFKRAESKWSL